jgi:hypothetical protein
MLVPQRDWTRLHGHQLASLPQENARAAIHSDPAHNSIQASKLTRVAASLALTCINSIVDGTQLTQLRPT